MIIIIITKYDTTFEKHNFLYYQKKNGIPSDNIFNYSKIGNIVHKFVISLYLVRYLKKYKINIFKRKIQNIFKRKRQKKCVLYKTLGNILNYF